MRFKHASAAIACAGALGASLPTAVTVGGQAPGHLIFVDQTIGVATCASYSPPARSCSGGRETAFSTLAGASTRTEPGTTVVIREGTYREPLVPTGSGTLDLPITFKAFEGETPTLSGIDAPAIQIVGREYVVVDGLAVSDTTGWGRLEDSRNVTIQNVEFRRAGAHGTTGGLKLVRSSTNRIVGNRFDDGNDNVMVQDASNGNVIAGNLFVTARHTLLCIKCSNANVVRGNVFANSTHKAMEIFDCEGGSDAPFRLDSTKRNLVEQNYFSITRGASRPYEYNGIQHGGQYSIVRRNVFLQDQGGGVAYQSYPQESLFVYGNRLYHNTFYDNRCFAVIGYSGDPKQYSDNRVMNNLFYKNRDCSGQGDQVSIADSGAVILSGNAMESRDPAFVDEQKHDFHLKSDSGMIDRAGSLTTAREAGQGTTMPVRDVMWFFDGFTIPGETGDEIQLLGTTDSARIVSIDYKANTLTLDRSLSWRSGQGVALKFAGVAPDYGAFEYGMDWSTNGLPRRAPKIPGR